MPSKSLNLPLLGETLTRHYRLACELYDTYPLGRFTHQLSQGTLAIDLTELDGSHLEALCHTISNKLSPIKIHVRITPTKEVGVKLLERSIEGISLCLSVSLTLTTLELDGIKLKGKVLEVLCQGLVKSRELKTLSVIKCWLGDGGTERVCQGIKNVPSITHLALVDCWVSGRGATAVACLIKHQKLNRDSAMWQDTLRRREPHLDGMRGLRRVTLNNNPQLGDTGVSALAEALTEDLWIKAMDLQNCGLAGEGARVLRTLLDTNQSLEVLDMRRNPFVPQNLPEEVIRLLQERENQYSQQYTWLEVTEANQGVEEGAEKGTRSYLTTGRTPLASKGGRRPSFTPSKKAPKAPSQLGIPWRVEHRLYERREGMAPGSMVDIVFKEPQENLTVTAASSAPQLSTKDAATQSNMKKQLEAYKRKYQRERKRRKHMEGKLSHLKTQLRGKHLLDDQDVAQIEECFGVFQSFLTHLQKSGNQWQSSTSHPKVKNNISPSVSQRADTSQPNTGPAHATERLPADESQVTVTDRTSHPPVGFPVPVVIHLGKFTEGKSIKGNKTADLINTGNSEQVLKNIPALGKVVKHQGMEISEDMLTGNGHPTGKPRRKASVQNTDTELLKGNAIVKHKETMRKRQGVAVREKDELFKVKEFYAKLKNGEGDISRKNAPRIPQEQRVSAKSLGREREEFESSDIASLASSDIQCAVSEGEIEFTGSDFDPHGEEEHLKKEDSVPSNHLRSEFGKRPENSEDIHSEGIQNLQINFKTKRLDCDNRKNINKTRTHTQEQDIDSQVKKSIEEHHEINHSNGTSETDDEKLRNIHSSLHLSARSGSLSSSSTLSITEHLSQSHSRWSKTAKKQDKQRLAESHQMRSLSEGRMMESNHGPKLDKSGLFKSNQGLRLEKYTLIDSSHGPKLNTDSPLESSQMKYVEKLSQMQSDKPSHTQTSQLKHSDKQGDVRSSQNRDQEQESTDQVVLAQMCDHMVDYPSGTAGEEEEYRSDFEQSEGDESISVTSLTTTSIPDDLLTPGEEDF